MITIRIGNETRKITDAGLERWIAQSIDGYRSAGQTVCVRVVIEEPGADFALSTAGCGGGGGMMRPLSSKEQEILDLWRKRGLSDATFAAGDLIAFLKQIAR